MAPLSYAKWDQLVDSEDEQPVLAASKPAAPAVQRCMPTSARQSSGKKTLTVDIISDPN